jgi:hypothetical protein
VGGKLPESFPASGSSESGARARQGVEAGNRFTFPFVVSVSDRRKAHESIGPCGPRFAGVRISAESKALELRGIVTSWSSE